MVCSAFQLYIPVIHILALFRAFPQLYVLRSTSEGRERLPLMLHQQSALFGLSLHNFQHAYKPIQLEYLPAQLYITLHENERTGQVAFPFYRTLAYRVRRSSE